MSRPAAAMAEAINRAFETPLSEGMNERTCSTRPSRWKTARRHGGVHREAQAGEQEQVVRSFRH
jgi:hypothetical protein